MFENEQQIEERLSEINLQLKFTLSNRQGWKQSWKKDVDTLLSIQKFLLKSGQWQLDNQGPTDKPHSSKNQLVQSWLNAARVDHRNFSKQPDRIGLSDITFPGDVILAGADWGGDLLLIGCAFLMKARFNSITIRGEISFAGSTFYDYTSFYGATFERSAIFRQCTFHAHNIFVFADFRRGINLQGSKFYRVPDFRDSKSFTPPRMDDVIVKNSLSGEVLPGVPDPRPAFYRRNSFKVAPDANIYAQYQTLRAFAKEANDYRMQSEFYAREIEARRFWVDQPFPQKKSIGLETLASDALERLKQQLEQIEIIREEDSSEKKRLQLPSEQLAALWANGSALRFWLGLFFGVTSDFGRSISRPLSLLLAFMGLFAAIYIGFGSENCAGSERWFASAITSISNSFVGIGSTSTGMQRAALSCLSGASDLDSQSLAITGSIYLQRILSAVWLFLLGLGIRNTLKLG